MDSRGTFIHAKSRFPRARCFRRAWLTVKSQGGYFYFPLLPRRRMEGRRRAASRSIAIETPKSPRRVRHTHWPHPPSQEDALLREQIDKHGGPGNWTAIAEALVGRSSKSCRLR